LYTQNRKPKSRIKKSRIKKPRGSDIELSNPYGDQATHFVGCIENPNAENSSHNHRKIGITFDARPTICISFVNKIKTQVDWATCVG
jgi:hypothetical protein